MIVSQWRDQASIVSRKISLWMAGVLLAGLLPLHGWAAALPAPTMDPAPVNGELDPALIAMSDVQVSTMPGGPTYSQQPLTLILSLANGNEVYRVQTTVGLSARMIKLPIPKAEFEKNPGAAMQIHYEVGSQAVSDKFPFTVTQAFAGTHVLDLTSKRLLLVYQDGEMRLPAQGPARDPLSFTREAPGASEYTSSDPSIATVDSSGRVIAQRNGKTTITAQTQAGQQSYVLAVVGLREFEVISRQGVTWAAATQSCQSLGRRLPEALDLNDIKDTYPGGMRRLVLPDYPIWGAAQGAGTALTFNPRTDVVTGESMDQNTLRQVACVGS